MSFKQKSNNNIGITANPSSLYHEIINNDLKQYSNSNEITFYPVVVIDNEKCKIDINWIDIFTFIPSNNYCKINTTISYEANSEQITEKDIEDIVLKSFANFKNEFENSNFSILSSTTTVELTDEIKNNSIHKLLEEVNRYIKIK